MKGIISDLDGVIVFTDKFHYQAWKKTADRLGVAGKMFAYGFKMAREAGFKAMRIGGGGI